MSYYLMLLVGAVLVNNFVLSRFLGCCPFLGVSKKLDTALGMSGAVVFVMTVAAAVTWCLDHWLLQPNGLGYIHTLAQATQERGARADSRRGAREHDVLAAVVAEALEKRESAAEVVVVVLERDLRRLADGLERREVDGRAEGTFLPCPGRR